MTLPYLDSDGLARVLPVTAAIDALEHALRAGLDTGSDPPRSTILADAGQMLLMPSVTAGQVGVKLVTVAPGNAELGRPRIQGVFVLFDPATLAPVALIDGIALTSLRTPAVSALALRHAAAPDASRLVVFGTGPQAEGHVGAVRAVRPITEVVIVGRDVAAAEVLADRFRKPGLSVSCGSPDAVAGADIIVCATSSREPLFAGDLVGDGACVVALGSHEPTAREVDAGLVRRSRIVVEDVPTALREAGDLVLAGASAADLLSLADLINNTPSTQDTRPVLVKTVGMAWEDVVVASAAVAAAS